MRILAICGSLHRNIRTTRNGWSRYSDIRTICNGIPMWSLSFLTKEHQNASLLKICHREVWVPLILFVLLLCLSRRSWYGIFHLLTITADNGKEFAKHQEIAEKLEISFYFCKPYHSWERGANENTNGLIRQYIPKGTDLSGITDEFVGWVENKLNNRPRKRLGYLTPNEKFNSILTN